MRGSMGDFVKLLVYCFLMSIIANCTGLNTMFPGQSVSDGETLVSSAQSFELGFFSPGESSRRYLAIWFKKISLETVVWVANRETPLLDRSGVLHFTRQGTLVLENATKGVAWSSNVTRTGKNPVAQLLDSGNFAVKDANDNNSNPDNFLWQSFDYPGNTNLEGMKLGRNFVTGLDWSISSWKSPDDPARGQFTFGVDPRGYPQLMLKKGSTILFRPGCWNGIRFTGVLGMIPNPVYKYEFVFTEKEVYYSIELFNKSVVSKLVIEVSGIVERLTWIHQTHSWDRNVATGIDQCAKFATCGENAKCNINSPQCACMDGFVPKSPGGWSLKDYSAGCVRNTPLSCRKGEGFVKYMDVNLPDTSNSWFNTSIMILKECEDMCLRNCSCVAYANTDIRAGGSGCLLWFSGLIDMRDLAGSGQDIYIRMSASYIDHVKRKKQLRKVKQIGIIICSTLFIVGLIVVLLIFLRKRKLQKQDRSTKEDLELPTIELSVIMKATENFSVENKLGQGGFGPVYKGTLQDGQEIAVKRLSMGSEQGVEEFKNEVLLIAKLQHRNLVKLLGCCIQSGERMLIYEYLSNKSLDYFIFDPTRSKLLDSQKRLSIIDGIARGLLYLHQDSRLRIIHRDLKASNVLLDNNLNPKISDFGMARIVGGDQTEANTSRVVGTYGYMAPEYAVDGLFSVKSDIFSFGVLVLEIVSGRRNRGFYSQNHCHNLLGHAWRLWLDERPLELLEDISGEATVISEIIRCIHIGLLCVQQRPEDRPNMSTVVLMLGGEGTLPQPKQPGFFTERNVPEQESSSSASINDITVTMLDPR
ncbi:hypothetical protein K2173_013278 [Erythroxylum novogranatense]|uniref:Receptor-like serine/threonine-protein kinase n=1 Tax=Erythroxylum novogranatense TaxID=1862640 RepID=A0AAV8S9P5_9ROSI|nr:hypothetical protein K2173_013278 [Erythroxylum novogranatense]